MNCPKCQHPMEKYPLDGCLVDYCTSCKGVWCDNADMEQLKVPDIHVNVAQLVMQLRLELVQEKANQALQMYCPRCVTNPLQHIHTKGLTLDVCKLCDGTFFDKGELERYLYLSKPRLKRVYIQFVKAIKTVLRVS